MGKAVPENTICRCSRTPWIGRPSLRQMDFWNGLLEMGRIYEPVGWLGDVSGQKAEREVEKPDRDIFDKQSPYH